jgi:molybdopterin-containing oxidoreductase family membrane subunit
MTGLFEFLRGCLRQILHGGLAYRLWILALLCVIAVGAVAYGHQTSVGLIATHMRDDVSWAFYIENFTFMVGVGAAAVLLVIPAYVYHWKPIKEVAVLGELLAISALIMAVLFILVDIGHPERFLHLAPLLGTPNWPRSMLTWDAMVLHGYLILNCVLVLYLLFKTYRGEPYDRRIFLPLVLLSVPVAISTHTVTAFLFNGMAARPYWNASILAPRFLASAFCSGPALMIILFQLLRRTSGFPFKDEAIWKIAELMSYAMFVNLFLLGAELFKEYYSATEHLAYTQYLWNGIGGHRTLVKYGWTSLACGVTAFFLLLVPRTRKRYLTLNLGCVLIWIGVYIEKGVGLIIPGFTPSTLGQIYEYEPSATEWGVAAGIFGIGFLVFTCLVKVAVPILLGTFRAVEPAFATPAPAGPVAAADAAGQ